MRKKSDKVQLLIWVPPSVDNDFRQMIQNKYERYQRGMLSYEGEMALRHWVGLHTGTQNTNHKLNPTPKVQSVYALVKNYLLNQSYREDGSPRYNEIPSGAQIPTKHLILAIQNIRGSDKRTVNKWLERFQQNGLIRLISIDTTVEMM